MRNRAEMVRLARLRKFYSIKGDGVARLRLDDAVTNNRFKANIRKLADLELDSSSSSTEAPQSGVSLAQ